MSIQMLIWGLSAPNVIQPHQTKKLIGGEITAELQTLLLKVNLTINATDTLAGGGGKVPKLARSNPWPR